MMKKDNAESNELGRKFRVLGAAIWKKSAVGLVSGIRKK